MFKLSSSSTVPIRTGKYLMKIYAFKAKGKDIPVTGHGGP
jgi:hypothetical protein